MRRPVPMTDDQDGIPVPITELEEEIKKLRLLTNEIEGEIDAIKRQRAEFEAKLAAERAQGLHAHIVKGSRVDPQSHGQ